METALFSDYSECDIAFNVMPARNVRETLRMREFRIGDSWIEAEFDRTYATAMSHSPNHLTFVSALIQMQKITYVYCCHRFSFPLNLKEEEALKVWPTDLRVSMRDLVRQEDRLVHRVDFGAFKRVQERKYLTSAISRVNGVLQIDGNAMIQLLRDPG